MLNGTPLVAELRKLRIDTGLIAHNPRFRVNVFLDCREQNLCAAMFDMEDFDSTTALCHTEECRLFLEAVFSMMFSTEVRFVYLYNAKEFTLGLLKRSADTVVHKPCSLLRYTDLFGKLDRGNPLFPCCKEIDSDEPLAHGDFAFTEERPGFDCKVAAALRTAIPFTVREAHNLAVLAVRTIIALSKADFLEVFTASIFIIEHSHELGEVLKLVFHTVELISGV